MGFAPSKSGGNRPAVIRALIVRNGHSPSSVTATVRPSSPLGRHNANVRLQINLGGRFGVVASAKADAGSAKNESALPTQRRRG